MPTWHALSPSQHAQMGWRPVSDFSIAQTRSIVPALQAELAYLLPHYVLAFAQSNKVDGTQHFQLMVVLSLLPERNTFVDAQGLWSVPYVPAQLRQYPFALITAPDDALTVCIDVDSLSLQAAGQDGVQTFFGDDSQPSAPLRQVINFLQTVHQSQALTDGLAQQLADAGVLEPWAIEVQRDGHNTEIKGLHHINLKALQALTAYQVGQLNVSGALELAYAQVLSEPRLQALKDAAQTPLPQPGLSEFGFFNEGGTISFGL